MDPITYKILHVIGALFLFAGIGGLLGIGENRGQINKLVSIFSGIGLLLLLVAGMGLQAKLVQAWPLWLILKLVIWVVMIVIFVLAKKEKMAPKMAVWISLVLGAVVAWLCLAKPFLS